MKDAKNVNHQFFDRLNLGLLKKWWIDVDKINFLIITCMMVFGVMMIASTSPILAKKLSLESTYFLKKQSVFAVLGFFLIIFLSILDYKKIKLISIAGLAGAVILLMAVLIFGSEIKGSKRWLSIFGINIQPSEFAKTFFVVVNAFILTKFHDRKFFLNYSLSLALYLSMVALLVLQPDFGMVFTFTMIWAAQLFLFGLPMLLVFSLSIAGIIGFVFVYRNFPHVQDRIMRFLDMGSSNYQAERSLDAFVSGSFFGKGPTNGFVKDFIPDAHTDFIFAVIAEEFGIISCSFILLIFLYLITRILIRASSEKNMVRYLALCGLAAQFTIQIIVNVGVSLSVLPTKGMTLPLISYGGSSMIASSICFGFILALTKKKYHDETDYGNIKSHL